MYSLSHELIVAPTYKLARNGIYSSILRFVHIAIVFFLQRNCSNHNAHLTLFSRICWYVVCSSVIASIYNMYQSHNVKDINILILICPVNKILILLLFIKIVNITNKLYCYLTDKIRLRFECFQNHISNIYIMK